MADKLFIDGKWVDALDDQTFPSRNPANGSVIGLAADAGPDDANLAVAAAISAFPDWSHATAYERSAILYRAHRCMLDHAETLARLMTEEQGKPLRAARNEVRYAADFL